MKIEKIIGIGFFIAILSLLGIQLIIYFEPITYDGSAKRVYVEDDIAYIADDFYGLVIFDVSTPSEPIELSQLDMGRASDIYVHNYVVFFNANDKISLIDVANPLLPNKISELIISGSDIDGMYAEFPFFYFYDRIDGDFWIYNFSDYFNPSQLGHINLGVRISDVYVSGNLAYITNSNGLKIIDISNSSNPSEIGQLHKPDYDFYHNCIVDGDLAFVTEWLGALYIIDVSDPSNPTMLSQFNEGGMSFIDSGIAILDDTLYYSDLNDGLELIDVSNPLKPFKYAQFDLRSPADVFIIYPYAYLACGFDGLKIVDISNPSFWNFTPSILNFAITIVSIGFIVSIILLKLRIRKKNKKG